MLKDVGDKTVEELLHETLTDPFPGAASKQLLVDYGLSAGAGAAPGSTEGADVGALKEALPIVGAIIGGPVTAGAAVIAKLTDFGVKSFQSAAKMQQAFSGLSTVDDDAQRAAIEASNESASLQGFLADRPDLTEPPPALEPSPPPRPPGLGPGDLTPPAPVPLRRGFARGWAWLWRQLLRPFKVGV